MIALALTAMIQTEAPLPCLRDGDTISGEFRYVESKHPNGTALRHGFVVLNEPVCFSSALNDPPVPVSGRWIDVFGELDSSGVQPGDGVTVEVSDCFEPMTAWHLGEINCVHARIVTRDPM